MGIAYFRKDMKRRAGRVEGNQGDLPQGTTFEAGHIS